MTHVNAVVCGAVWEEGDDYHMCAQPALHDVHICGEENCDLTVAFAAIKPSGRTPRLNERMKKMAEIGKIVAVRQYEPINGLEPTPQPLPEPEPETEGAPVEETVAL
jgi:hypothetical protein